MSEIEIFVNGATRPLAAGLRLSDLLAEIGRDPRTVAVEHNGVIVPRSAYGDTELRSEDRLEIVHFVQGG